MGSYCFLQEVTALQFDEDGGFLMAVGSSDGKVCWWKANWQYYVNIFRKLHNVYLQLYQSMYQIVK